MLAQKSSSKKLNVVFTCDQNYVQHFCVALTSLLENNPNIIARVFLVSNHIAAKIHKAIDFFKITYLVTVELLLLDDSIFRGLKISHQINSAGYYKLLLATIIPDEIQEILYLDSDIVVAGNISALLAVDFDTTHYALAVRDTLSLAQLATLNSRLNSQIQKYFNAGVMLLNLQQLRQKNAANIMLSIAHDKKSVIQWLDQDVLNIFFNNKWTELPQLYNAHHLRHRLEQLPLIIHFTGSYKPWQWANSHPYRKLYWYYLSKTPFKQLIPSFNLIAMLKAYLPVKIKHLLRFITKNIHR